VWIRHRYIADDDESVISILEDRTEEVIHKRVKKEALSRGLQDHILQDIHNNIKEEGGRGSP
jgi:hypothetical protein